MIQINDNDSPITVAEKIINGTKPYSYPTEGWKNLSKAITGTVQLVMKLEMKLKGF